MESMGIVAILTDFGRQDWYLASMKGVILSKSPETSFVDISQDIDPGDVRSGSFVLAQAVADFPASTTFLCVIDPGVGSSRRAIALLADSKYFVGPDNGLFSFLLEARPADFEVRCIDRKRIPERSLSATFHGRDLFAPAVAYLSAGGEFSGIGPEVREPIIQLSRPRLNYGVGQVEGEVLYVDRFGNAITNIEQAACQSRFPRCRAEMHWQGVALALHRTFANVPEGCALIYYGSCGLLEIGVNGRNAASELGLRVGTPIRVDFKD